MQGPFFADDQVKLVNDLRDILARIGIPETEVTLGAPIVSTVKEVIHSHTDTFLARDDVIPASLADPDDIRLARIVRADHRDNVLFTSSVEVPGFRGHLRATNIYRVTDETQPRTAREADFTELWDAGEELQDDDPDARVLFFNRRNQTALLAFNTSTVTPADLGVSAGYLGALTDEDARDIVVQVMRGYRLVLDPVTRSPYDSSGRFELFSPRCERGSHVEALREHRGGGRGDLESAALARFRPSSEPFRRVRSRRLDRGRRLLLGSLQPEDSRPLRVERGDSPGLRRRDRSGELRLHSRTTRCRSPLGRLPGAATL